MGERIEILRAFRGWVVTRFDELADLLTAETGKPITQSRNELNGLLPRIDFFLDEAERTLADEVVLDAPDEGLREVIAHEPLGVIANISAWNYPYFVGSNVFVPALLAGNAVVYKPSEFATLTGLAIASMLNEAGVPVDVFSVVVGDGSVGRRAPLAPARRGVLHRLARHRAAHRRVGGLTPHPRAARAGRQGPGLRLTDDVDVDAAAEALADGAFYNNGQSCCSVERIYVHDAVARRVRRALRGHRQGVRAGRPGRRGHLPGPAHPPRPGRRARVAGHRRHRPGRGGAHRGEPWSTAPPGRRRWAPGSPPPC